MKRLLSLTALVLLTCSAVGCECCGIGNGGLFQRRRSECGCNQCNTCGRCNSCSQGESYSPMIAPSGCGCGCGAGGPIGDGMMLRSPSISPAAEAITVSPQ